MNVQKSDWSSVIESEISKDLSSMQMQPAIMENYRRFVIVKATRDDHLAWNKDGVSRQRDDGPCGLTDLSKFEWVPLSNFDFKDDFFPKQTRLETSLTEIRS
jgi:hypothetical protein